jgi:hypothetical protein
MLRRRELNYDYDKSKTAIIATAAAIGGMLIGQVAPVQAQLGDILKGGAVIVVVDKFSGQIDRFVNTLTGNKANNTTESTRVVPILSVGRGTFAGAVQVTGPKDLVDQVKAVAQIEGRPRSPERSAPGRSSRSRPAASATRANCLASRVSVFPH